MWMSSDEPCLVRKWAIQLSGGSEPRPWIHGSKHMWRVAMSLPQVPRVEGPLQLFDGRVDVLMVTVCYTCLAPRIFTWVKGSNHVDKQNTDVRDCHLAHQSLYFGGAVFVSGPPDLYLD